MRLTCFLLGFACGGLATFTTEGWKPAALAFILYGLIEIAGLVYATQEQKRDRRRMLEQRRV